MLAWCHPELASAHIIQQCRQGAEIHSDGNYLSCRVSLAFSERYQPYYDVAISSML